MKTIAFLILAVVLMAGGTGCGPSGPVDPQTARLREVITQLGSGSPEDRRIAAEELGQLKAKSAVAPLLKALSDSQLAVRLAAAAALGAIGDKAAAPGLVTILDDGNPQVRKTAADALGAIGDASVLPVLLARLSDDAAIVRQAAAGALGKLGGSALEALLQAAGDSNNATRAGAIYALGSVKDSRATDALLAALRDAHLTVRRNAADALGRARDDRAVPALAELVAKPLTDEDRKRYLAEQEKPLSPKVLAETGALLRQRQAFQATPTGGSYPHQADGLRRTFAEEAKRIGEIVAPPLTDTKRAEIELCVSDRIGSETFAKLTRDQRDIAVAKELMFLNDLAKPPSDGEKDERLGQIRARRIAREWWDKLGPAGQEKAVRAELARRLTDELRQEEVETRQAAATALAQIGSPASVTALLGLLDAGNSETRTEAQDALEKMGAPLAAPLAAVIIAPATPANVSRRAMDMLAGAVEPRRHKIPGAVRQTQAGPVVDALLVVFERAAPEFQLRAAAALSQLGTAATQVFEPLVNALKSPDVELRRTAAKSLGQLGDKRATEPLIAAARDSDLAVRLAAAQALGELGEQRAGAALIALLKSFPASTDADTLMPVVRALGRVKDKNSVEVLLPLLQRTSGLQRTSKGAPELLSAVATALGQAGNPAAVEPLITLMRSGPWGPCFTAATALGEIGDPRAIDALVEQVPKTYPEFREVAIKALGKIRDARAVDALLALGRLADSRNQKFAAEALMVQGEFAVPALVKTLADDNAEIRGLAAQVLGGIGQPAAEPVIQFIGSSPAPSKGSLGAAIYALSAIRDPRVVPPLVGLLQHADPEIRANAAWALGFSSDAGAVAKLKALATSDTDPKVREAALAAFNRANTTAQ